MHVRNDLPSWDCFVSVLQPFIENKFSRGRGNVKLTLRSSLVAYQAGADPRLTLAFIVHNSIPPLNETVGYLSIAGLPEALSFPIRIDTPG